MDQAFWATLLPYLLIGLPLLFVGFRFYASRQQLTMAQVLANAGTYVDAVNQMFREKPEGMTSEEWNATRLNAAIAAAQNTALSLGITLKDVDVAAIKIAIEAYIYWQNSQKKKANVSVNVLGNTEIVRAVEKETGDLYENQRNRIKTVNEARAESGLGRPVPWGDTPLQRGVENWVPATNDTK